jgi:histidinol-phosphate phosphatase family protein
MKVIFLDRDGVINEYPGDADYVKSWQEFRFLPSAKEALKKLNQAGFLLHVISNQAGINKGIYTQENLDRITANMVRELAEQGVKVSGVHYCTHKEEEKCSCRKPKTGLVEKVLTELKSQGTPIRLDESYFIGDTLRDIETGKKAGLKTILVFSGKEKPQSQSLWPIRPDFTAHDLSEAATIILQ